MQRWLFAIVATVLAYVTLLKLPTLLGDFVYGLGGGADQLVDDAGPLLALGLALWVLFGADKPLARPWRLGGVAVAYVVGVTLLRHSIQYLHIPRTYEYQPTILIISVPVIAFGLLLTIGDFDEARLRRWTLLSLLSGAAGCLFIDFLHWFLPPATFKYAPCQSTPALLLIGGILLKRSSDEPLFQLLVRWALGYAIASFGAGILLNYKEAGRGFWYWLFDGLYAGAAIAIGTVVVGAAAFIFVAPASLFRTRRSPAVAD
jgi:hypothetical protein